jgi:4'-phosphopantetheinyl transferase EntD
LGFISLKLTLPNIRVGIWEEEAGASPIQAIELPEPERTYLETIAHGPRRSQSYYARLCLHYLLADFPPFFVTHNAKQAPYLCPRWGSISLGHTQGMSAAIFSDIYKVGIDLEFLRRPYLPQTVSYFMSATERNWYDRAPASRQPFIYFLTWCAKEAVYKLFSPWALLSFRNHIRLLPQTLTCQSIKASVLIGNHSFLLDIEYFQRNDFLICYAFKD